MIHLGTDDYYTLKRITDYADREARIVVLRMIKHLMNRYGIQYSLPPTIKSLKKKYHCDFTLFENGQAIGIVILNHNDNFQGLKVLQEKYREYKELSRIEVFYLREDRTVQTSSTHKTFRGWLENLNAIENEEDNGYIHFALIKDFFAKYFGINEYRCFRWYVNRYNLKTQTAIGYRTIITPTEDAVQLFKEKCSQRLRDTDIDSVLPTWFPSEQVQIMKQTYFDRGLYKAMVGNAAFADSYISSEWYYEIFKVTGAIDRTGVVTGYLKSVEQLLSSIIELHKGENDKTIKERGGYEFIPYSYENEDDHDKTLNALIGFVKHYDDIWLITPDVKQPIIQALNKWREEFRNGYFHKDNLHDEIIVAGIRKTAYSLYAMILGSFVIRDDQLSKIGIDEPTVFIPESPEVLYNRFEKWAAPIIKFDIPDNTVALAFVISPKTKEDKWEIVIQALSHFEKTDFTWNQDMLTSPRFLYSSFQWKDNRSWKEMITVVIQMVDRLRTEASPLLDALNAIRTIVVGSDEPIKIFGEI